MQASRLRALWPLFLVLVWFAGPASAFQTAPRIESFSPQGVVKRVRQVQVRFSEAIVPFGDPRQVVEPFEIDCGEEGTARWVDPTTWVYDFDRDLPAGVFCEFRLRPQLTTLSGVALQGRRIFRFSTGGPAIIRSTPWEGSQHVDEDQVFILELDARVKSASVLDHAYFTVQGTVERIGARIIDGEPRREILDSSYPYRERDEEVEQRLILLGAKLSFPQQARLKLVWGAGIETSGGVASTQDQVLSFQTRPAFFATFHCTRENADSPCVALTSMRVQLSAPIRQEDASQFHLAGPNGFQSKPRFPSPPPEYVNWVVFEGPFPANSSFELSLPADLEDDAGRPLVNRASFPLLVKTGELPPLAKFSGRFGVLESEAGGILPVTVRNLEAELDFAALDLHQEALPGTVLKVDPGDVSAMVSWLRRLYRRAWKDRERSIFTPPEPPTPAQAEANALLQSGGEAQAPELELKSIPEQLRRFTLPKPNGAKAFEVMGIPLEKPGFYVVELESRVLGEALLGKPTSMYVPAAALVTNLAVHFKWGIENSLAWVTQLDSGRPAAGVGVQVWDCTGTMLAESQTDEQGLAWLRDLPAPSDGLYCSWNDFENGLLVTARDRNDFSFVHSNWNEGIEPWRFQVPLQYDDALVTAETVFDRPLFRPGETVHMKHLARQRTGRGFALLDPPLRPNLLRIAHNGSDQKYEWPIELDGSGVAESAWEIPAEARLGSYSVQLVRSGQKDHEEPFFAGSFRVEEFRVPLMRGYLRWPEGQLVSPREVPVDLSVEYLAGGTAGFLPAAFRYQIRAGGGRSFPDFEGFDFAGGRLEVGVFRRGRAETPAEPLLHRQALELDANGSARVLIEDLPELEEPVRISAELEFRDPNGEIQTVSSSLPLWSSSWLVGVKPKSWAHSAEDLSFQVAVVDLEGRPVGGVAVSVDAYRRLTRSHRKRLVGGFYAYEHVREVSRVALVCEGRTDEQGLLECQQAAPASGNLILQAAIQDPQGRPAFAQASVWVAGGDEWWFEVSDDDRIDLIPEENRYEPGQEAVFQVRMPFRQATALVTVEREGIIRAYLRRLTGREPVIRVPVEASDAPNLFVSALVVRGRTGEVQPTALVDLGKPAFKLGIAQIQVGWKAHQLNVRVLTDRQVYQVRDTAIVDVQVEPAGRGSLPEDAEIALAAVDEGLLELLPNHSWNLLENMMGRRGLAVRTATMQSLVVGKRHFGLKALPQGGGGGKSATRDLFDTLLLWKGRIPLDRGGRAMIEVPLNDSLTSFRIVAVASAGPDLFGSGSASIRSTQDLILFSGIPPLVRSGDQVEAGFTVRNASELDLNVEVTARLHPEAVPLPSRQFSLPAGQSRLWSWKIDVPEGVDLLRYEVRAASDTGEVDALQIDQRVVSAVPVRTVQATLAQMAPAVSLPIQQPRGALAGRGGLQLDFSPTLLVGLDSVREYMDQYPYTCLEQVVSKAVALNDQPRWNRIVAALPAFLDDDGLAKYFPSCRWGSDSLTAYLLSISHQRGWTIPAPILEQMSNGLEGFVAGRVVRYSRLATTDLALRKLAALEALSRQREIEPRQLQSIALQPNLWPTSGVIDWLLVLHRSPQLPQREARLQEAEQILRARLNLQGTTMGFSTENRDRLWWLMVSPDLNAVRLVLALLETGRGSADLPRLITGALGRRRRGHWDVTTANSWGVLAAEAFAARFEQESVSGVSEVRLAAQPARSFDWNQETLGGSLEFPWPSDEADLEVRHLGSGAPWLALRSRVALPLTEELFSGYRIRRTVIPVERATQEGWTQGDVARVRLELEAQADMTWVVVQDPIPAGANILGSGLGRDSSQLSAGERTEGPRPIFEERSFEAFRAYYEFVPKGTWTVQYTVRLNNAGRFKLPPTRVEALYHPEAFGEAPNPDWTVAP